VLDRLLYACLPLPSNNYLEKLKPMPDLYGPLWVCITLIFSTSISGNMSDFFNSLGADTEFVYQYGKGDFDHSFTLLDVNICYNY